MAKKILLKAKPFGLSIRRGGEDCPTLMRNLVQAWLGYSITTQILRKPAKKIWLKAKPFGLSTVWKTVLLS